MLSSSCKEDAVNTVAVLLNELFVYYLSAEIITSKCHGYVLGHSGVINILRLGCVMLK